MEERVSRVPADDEPTGNTGPHHLEFTGSDAEQIRFREERAMAFFSSSRPDGFP